MKYSIKQTLAVVICLCVTGGVAGVLMHFATAKISMTEQFFQFEEDILFAIDHVAADLEKILQATQENRTFNNPEELVVGTALTKNVFGVVTDSNADQAWVTDENGVVLASTVVSGLDGTYIFDTTNYGALVAEGKAVRAIDTIGEEPTLYLIAGAPIFSADGLIIGSLFVARSIDSHVLASLQGVLPPGTEVGIYSKEFGLAASTFTPDAHRQVDNHLHPRIRGFTAEESYIQQVFVIDTVYELFTIDNVALRYESLAGGLVVFIPVQTPAGWVLLLSIASIIAIVFVSLMLATGWFAQAGVWRRGGWLLIAFAVAGVTSWWVYQSASVEVKRYYTSTALPIYNSTITLSPASGVLNVSFPQTIAIVLESGGEPINAAEAELRFDPTMMRVEDVFIRNSFCEPSFIIERLIDNESGVVRISCGTSVPFVERSAVIAELVVQPLQVGTAELRLTDTTGVYAHDGLGTNVLRKRTSGGYTIRESEEVTDTLIFSRSHPNTTRWYNDASVELTWRADPLDSFEYQFTNVFDTGISAIFTPTNKRTVTLQPVTDGVYTFLLKNTTTDDVHSYKVLVDRTPPETPSIKISDQEVTAGDVVRLEFSSTDITSGIEQPYYYISFNDGTFFPVQSPLYTAIPSVGAHRITIRAFDQAGNFADADITVQANPTASLVQNGAAVAAAMYEYIDKKQ